MGQFFDSGGGNIVSSGLGSLTSAFGSGFDFAAFKRQWEGALSDFSANLDRYKADYRAAYDNLGAQAGAADTQSERSATAVIAIAALLFIGLSVFLIVKLKE